MTRSRRVTIERYFFLLAHGRRFLFTKYRVSSSFSSVTAVVRLKGTIFHTFQISHLLRTKVFEVNRTISEENQRQHEDRECSLLYTFVSTFLYVCVCVLGDRIYIYIYIYSVRLRESPENTPIVRLRLHVRLRKEASIYIYQNKPLRRDSTCETKSLSLSLSLAIYIYIYDTLTHVERNGKKDIINPGIKDMS